MGLLEDGFATLQDLRAAFEAEGQPSCHIFLYAQRGREKRDRWKRMKIDGALSGRLSEVVRESFTEMQVKAADDAALVEFDFDNMVGGSLGVLKSDDVEPVKQWIDDCPLPDWDALYTGETSYTDKIRFFCTRVQFPDGRELRIFRGRRGVQTILEMQQGISAFFRRDTQEFQPIDGVVVHLDQNVDFFEWDGYVFVSNLASFESLTNLRAVTIAKAHQAVDAIEQQFTIANPGRLKEELGKRTRLAKKLAAAAQHGVIGDIDAEALIARIAHKQSSLVCRKDGNSYLLEFNVEDRGEVEEFVNMMTDFYLQSPVTRREWKAYVKRPG